MPLDGDANGLTHSASISLTCPLSSRQLALHTRDSMFGACFILDSSASAQGVDRSRARGTRSEKAQHSAEEEEAEKG